MLAGRFVYAGGGWFRGISSLGLVFLWVGGGWDSSFVAGGVSNTAIYHHRDHHPA